MASGFASGRSAYIALALLPVVVPTAYLLYLRRKVSGKTRSSSGRRTPQTPESPLPSKPISLPPYVASNDSKWVLAYERVVSDNVPASDIAFPIDLRATLKPDQPVSELLIAYSQAAQVAFSWTPQAFVIRAMIKENQFRRTFSRGWIQSLVFNDGDVVNGVYKVVYHGKGIRRASQRVELALEAPPSYKGPPVNGLIITEVQMSDGGQGDEVVFVNETWMWRRNDEKLTLLETPAGSWLHTLTAGWLVLKGIRAVTGDMRKTE